LPQVVAAALAAGCRWISVREKDLPPEEQILLARSLVPLAHATGAKLMVHGEATLARDAGADGVHLPSGSDLAAARALIGGDKLLGVSIHTVTEAEAIDPAHVDYVLAGPAFETASKPGYGPEIGRKGLAEIARAARAPVLAIGGINAARVGELIASGAAGVAVMGVVMRAGDPAREVAALIATLEGALAIRA
jgi:thiamine-phosphate pyrophosphorylase